MAGVPEETLKHDTHRQGPPLDVQLSALADRQHGVVSLPQLESLGLTASAVRSRVRAGRLHRKYRGVYAVGRAQLTREGAWMAAVLAYGPRAVLSHRSAAGLWGLRPDNRPVTDITVPVAAVRSRPGIAAHASETLTNRDVTEQDAIPCTSVARTLLDLAEAVDRRSLERAIEQAEILKLFDLRALRTVLTGASGRRGAGVLRDVLGGLDEITTPPENANEERFLALCRAAGLPRPEAGVWLTLPRGDPIRVDYLWRGAGLAIECDSWQFHGTRQAFERDRARDVQAAALGIETLRFTWRQLTREPDKVIPLVAAVLEHRNAARAA
ncbi:MAG TPA: type IV toxin-antitoxin system AbiEi family antitoxin domain-containing protein [Thermoleophilaceae bacterium]|nr:type IV toxin-antitoxin system AbiEi family antitoxin domain-containing protein [Thermoleophilaceae bacterium]